MLLNNSDMGIGFGIDDYIGPTMKRFNLFHSDSACLTKTSLIVFILFEISLLYN